ncbi:MAG: hypothetical protein LBM77_05345 [Spirochaetaceae bacterium]|nr:hypothetical protein [Spirochaetaceae bacterium]
MRTMTGSTQALDYYYAHQKEINAGHLGKYVAIKDDKVEGYYDDFMEAFWAMVKGKGYERLTFNVVHCMPDDEWMGHLGFLELKGDTEWQD